MFELLGETRVNTSHTMPNWTPIPIDKLRIKRVGEQFRFSPSETERPPIKVRQLRDAVKQSSHLIRQSKHATELSPTNKKHRAKVREFVTYASSPKTSPRPRTGSSSRPLTSSGTLSRPRTSEHASRPHTSEVGSRPTTSGSTTSHSRSTSHGRHRTRKPRQRKLHARAPSIHDHKEHGSRKATKLRMHVAAGRRSEGLAVGRTKSTLSFRSQQSMRSFADSVMEDLHKETSGLFCEGCEQGCLFCRGSQDVIDDSRANWRERQARREDFKAAQEAAANEALEEQQHRDASESGVHLPHTHVIATMIPHYKPTSAEGTSVAFGSSISLASFEGLFLSTEKYAKHSQHYDKNFIFKVYSCDNPDDIRVINYKEQVFLTTSDSR